MEQQIELTCEVCGKKFLRRKAEVKRNAKKGRQVYCSLKCSGVNNNSHLEKWQKQSRPISMRITDDEYSPFRYILKTVRTHCKQKGRSFEVTLQDLKKQWEEQGGRCPYTGWELKMSTNSSQQNQLPKTPDRASLDRIDSSRPYTKDNIQFVSMIAQFAKNDWDGSEILTFAEAVVNHSYR